MQKQQFLRDFYLKLKLLKKTANKEIWLVKNTLDNQICVAKIQPVDIGKKSNNRNVLHQGKFLQATQGYMGIPFLNWAGKEESIGVNIIIVQQLGYTLEDLFLQTKQKFSLKTVCQLGIQMLKIVESYHEKGYLNGNIKLNSFQFGVGSKSSTLYLNDLMQSQSYIKKGQHLKKQIGKNKQPLHQFMSFSKLEGYQSCRRDDVQSILLVLVFLLKGSLPWTRAFQRLNLKSSTNEFDESLFDPKDMSMSKEETKQDSLKFKKKLQSIQSAFVQKNKCINLVQNTPIQSLCQGLPVQFKNMIFQCRQIQFQSRPNYNYCIRMLRKMLIKNNIEEDYIYDWMPKHTNQPKVYKKQMLKFNLINEQQINEQCYLPFCQIIQLC